jgi:hypothetical protein
MTDFLNELCMALSIFGSVPDGHLPLVIESARIQVFVYSPEDKATVVRVLCRGNTL